MPEAALDLPEAAGGLPPLPEVAERDLVAHFTRLAHRSFGVDLGAYPLGSCTMKYNPKVCDWAAELARLARPPPGHPAGRSPRAPSRCCWRPRACSAR